MSSDVVLKASQTMASRPSFYGLGFGVGPEVPGLGLGLEVLGLGLGLERCIDIFWYHPQIQRLKTTLCPEKSCPLNMSKFLRK